MADRVPASIEVGGTLHTSLVPDLVAAALLDGGCSGWDEEALDETTIRSGETLEVFANAAAWGRFECLEEFCESHGLPFRLKAGSCSGSFGAERTLYDGNGRARVYEESGSGHVVISLDGIRKLGTIEAIEQWFAEAEAVTPPLVLAGATAPHDDDR